MSAEDFHLSVFSPVFNDATHNKIIDNAKKCDNFYKNDIKN